MLPPGARLLGSNEPTLSPAVTVTLVHTFDPEDIASPEQSSSLDPTQSMPQLVWGENRLRVSLGFGIRLAVFGPKSICNFKIKTVEEERVFWDQVVEVSELSQIYV